MLEEILIGQAKADFEKKFIEFQRQRPDIKDRFFDESLLKWFYNAELFIQVAYIIGWLESVDIWVIEYPVDGPDDWMVHVLEKDCMAPFYMAYRSEQGSNNRTLAKLEGIKFSIKSYNERNHEKKEEKVGGSDRLPETSDLRSDCSHGAVNSGGGDGVNIPGIPLAGTVKELTIPAWARVQMKEDDTVDESTLPPAPGTYKIINRWGAETILILNKWIDIKKHWERDQYQAWRLDIKYNYK